MLDLGLGSIQVFFKYFFYFSTLTLAYVRLNYSLGIRIFGKAAEYVKEDMASREKTKERIYDPSWSFEPLSSVQEIHGGFNSDTRLFSSTSGESPFRSAAQGPLRRSGESSFEVNT